MTMAVFVQVTLENGKGVMLNASHIISIEMPEMKMKSIPWTDEEILKFNELHGEDAELPEPKTIPQVSRGAVIELVNGKILKVDKEVNFERLYQKMRVG